jgi:hypothetical protein
MPYCPFCHRKHRSKRGEHIIPKWMSREFPNAKWELEDQLTKHVRKSTRYIHLTTPLPCPRCNNGWMSDLEKASKPILVPLMHGVTSILTPRDQIIIALWLVKTAMVYDLDAEKRAPRPRYFESQEMRAFASTASYFPTYMFFVGAYNGSRAGIFQEDHSGFTLTYRDELVAHDPVALGNPLRVYALTLVIKHLVLQICCAKTIESIGHFYMKDFRRLSTQIAAPPPADVRWPPTYAFGDELIDEFIKRWSDVPPTPRPASSARSIFQP